MIINTSNLNEAQKQIQKLKKDGQEIVVQAQSPEFNRKILENKNVDIFLGLEIHNRKSKLNQRDSGLNEVLCRLAKKNDIKIGIDFEKIIKLSSIEKAKILSRIMQNVYLSKKMGAQLIIYPKNKYKKQDVMGLFLSLRGSTKQGKEAV